MMQLWGWRQAERTRARRSVGITEITGYIKEFGRKVHESEVSSAPEWVGTQDIGELAGIKAREAIESAVCEKWG